MSAHRRLTGLHTLAEVAERNAFLNSIVVETDREVSWNPETRTFSCFSEPWAGSFPEKLSIRSHKTGKVVVFERDHELALANEFWDGEECHYYNTELNAKAVITHAY